MTLRRGFTLFELLVAVLIASLLILLIYNVYAVASKTYRVQNMALEMQGQARFGLGHLRRDLANAGFNATPNSSMDANLCFRPATELRAVVVRKTVAGVANPDQNTNIQSLEFTLLGDYSGNGEVFFTSSVVGATINLQVDFKTRVTKAEFDEMFKAPNQRYLRIVDKEQYEMLLPISSASYEAATIQLTQAPPVRTDAQSCGVQGFGEAMEVNPVNFIRYRVAQDTRAGADAGKFDLIREEVQLDGVTATAGTQLLIAENVVELTAYDFVFDNDTIGATPSLTFVADNSAEQIVNGGGQGLLGLTSAVTQNLRFMTLKLTVRGSDEDPDLLHSPRQSATAPITTYDVFSNLEGAARALTMTSKVMMKTLAVRNVKPGAG